MPIQFVNQLSTLSIFTPVDRETGDPLPTETWSDKLWATDFAQALTLNGLALTWTACTIYHHRQAYVIPAGLHVFTANPTYAISAVVWLDPSSPDNLTIDVVLLDGTQEAPPAPVAVDDVVRLAWGTIGAGATDITLNVLRHTGGL